MVPFFRIFDGRYFEDRLSAQQSTMVHKERKGDSAVRSVATIQLRMMAVTLSFAFAIFVVEGKPFCYLDEGDADEADCYGPEDWDRVDDEDDFYFDWDRFSDDNLSNKDECEWKPVGSRGSHTQSPVDLNRRENTCDIEKDDKHRQVLAHGTCKFEDLIWKLQPWGLEMTLPMRSSGNPEQSPCTKPNFDSSGGYGDSFFMNYLLVKSPGEHTFEGKSFDAEIQMGFFRYRGSDPSIFGGPPYTVHILVEAGNIQEDNLILKPYLDKWQQTHDELYEECAQKYGNRYGIVTKAPTVSPAPSGIPTTTPSNNPSGIPSRFPSAAPTRSVQPSSAPVPEPSAAPTISEPPTSIPSDAPTDAPTGTPSKAPSCEIFNLDTLVNDDNDDIRIERTNGIMFDLETGSNVGRTAITALDVMLWNSDVQSVSVYIKAGSWELGDAPNSIDQWTLVETVKVQGGRKYNPSSVPLRNPIVLEGDRAYGMYIVQTNDSDMYGIHYDNEQTLDLSPFVGQTSATSADGIFTLKVGMGVDLEGASSAFDPSKTFVGARGFTGTIYYDTCESTFSDTVVTSPIRRTDGNDRRRLQSDDQEDYDVKHTVDGNEKNASMRHVRERKARNQEERTLDHQHIDDWNDRSVKPPSDFSDPNLFWDPFRLWTSPWFLRYRGSLTMPQCFDDTRVRVLDRALQISQRQMAQIDTLIAEMRNRIGDSKECQLGTVGKPRNDGSGFVDVNRPLQERTSKHKMKYCNDGDFSQREFFKTPRGNTCWCLLEGTCPKGCGIDCAGNCYTNSPYADRDTQGRNSGLPCDEHWAPSEIGKWEARKCRSNSIYSYSEDDEK